MLPYKPVLTDDFNLYIKGAKTVSSASGIELPELSHIVQEVEGAGTLGKFEEPAIGQYESLVVKIPFTHLSREAYQLLNTLKPPEMSIYAAMQGILEPGDSDVYGVRITMRGKNKAFTQGKLEKGAKSDTEIEMELLYYKIEFDGETLFELDKLNYVCVVNGEDVVQKVRSLI